MQKRRIIEAFLPVLAVFSLLAYIFWGAMMDLLLQEYPVVYYNIFDNLPLGISLGACLLYGAIVWLLLSFGAFKIAAFLNGFLLFLLIVTFGYAHIFPYNYGPFVDNASMIPARSLLGFSPYRILFDIALLSGSVGLAFFAVYKKQSTFLFLVFFLYYGFLNIHAFTKVHKSVVFCSTQSSDYSLSSNHSNVILLVFDGICPQIFMHLYNTRYSESEKAWTKDFVFYDNTVSSFRSTRHSLASILGGSDFHAFKNSYKETLEQIPQSELLDDSYFIKKASLALQEKLEPSVDTRGLSSTKKLYSNNLPLVFVYIYKIVPYFMRHLFADKNYWRHANRVKSLAVGSEIPFSLKPTDKPVFLFEYWENTHAPWINPQSSIWTAETDEEITSVFYHNFGGVMNPVLNRLVSGLKERGIYNTSKIIVASDHGIHRYIRPDRLEKYYQSTLKDSFPFDIIGMLGSTLMIKDFGASKPKLQIDSFPMALWDIHPIVARAFGLSNAQELPSAGLDRVFQVYPHDVNGDKLRYLRVFNMKNRDLQILETNIEALQTMPPSYLRKP